MAVATSVGPSTISRVAPPGYPQHKTGRADDWLTVHFRYLGSMSDDWPMMVVKWHALSLKRLENFGELRRTGRWRHYFSTEDAFEEAFRKASANVEKWKQLADRSASSN